MVKMIKTALFVNGKPKKIAEGFAKGGKNSFRWIYAAEPTANEIDTLAKETGVKKRTLTEYSRAPRSKKYSTTPLEFVIADYYLNEGKLVTSHVLFAVTEDTLVTLIPKKAKYYDELFQRVMEEVKQSKRPTSLAGVLYRFLDEDTEDNYDVLHQNEAEIIKLEEEASSFEGEAIPAVEIVKFKRELFKMSRRFWATAKIIFLMRKGLTPAKLSESDRNLLDDTYDTFVHQIDILTTQQEMLTDVMTIYTTKVSNEISRRVKKLTYVTLVLTGLALVISVPNTVATVFGIPYFPHQFLADNWLWIAGALFASGLFSIAWLLYYWHKHGVYREENK